MTKVSRPEYWLLAIITIVFGFKPVIDTTWALKGHVGGFAINFQGVIGMAVVGWALILSVVAFFPKAERWSTTRPLAVLFLLFTALDLRHCLLEPLTAWWVVKYLSVAAGVVVIEWLLRRFKDTPRLKNLLVVSILAALAAVFVSCVMQLFNLIPWEYFDMNHKLGEDLSRPVGMFGRLTGFYHHPLDLVRVLIWVHLFLVIALIQNKIDWRKAETRWAAGFLFLDSILMMRTTHRASLIASVVAVMAVGVVLRQWKRTAVVFLIVFSGWTFWTFVPSAGGYYSVFNPEFFASERHGPSRHHLRFRVELFGTEYEIFRGRGDTWADHVYWMSDFTPSEFAFGTVRPYTGGDEDEPHNQLLDLLEIFGVVGLAILMGLGWVAIRTLGVPRPWIAGSLTIIALISLIAQPLGMPTFVWWAYLFMGSQFWATGWKLPFSSGALTRRLRVKKAAFSAT